ncbi:hypothetical protein [Paenibacillus sp. DCT19]|uniref:hypothetical protein n=1 Tax=Paenibacillus sp. DCT19 TaxID=2211212 RepID=UPI000FE1D6D3|nr:hypothetical protein [Paenibacillus sp. DCT19]
MGKVERTVRCRVCSNVQTGLTSEDEPLCSKCGGTVEMIGYLDRYGSYIPLCHKSPNEHNITLNIQLAPWLETLTQSLPKAFEEAVKAGMPVQVAHKECEEMVKRIISRAFTIHSGRVGGRISENLSADRPRRTYFA